MEPSQNPLATEKIGRLIAKFAIPSVLAMLVNALYNIVDQIFIGQDLGYLGNGAANVVGLIPMVALSLALLIGDGAAAYFSLRLGAGERENAARGVGTALWAVSVAGLLVMGVCLWFLEPILRLFGCTDVLLPYALEYGYLIVLGLPFALVTTALNSLLRADGSPRFAMLSMIAGAVLNACLDPILIFGLGWGLRGAAVSTLVSQLLSFGLSLSYLRRFKSVRLRRGLLGFQARVFWRIAGLGISSFIDQLAFTLVMAVNNRLITHYGAFTSYGREIPLTAYGISMKVQEILFTLLLGLAIGMQPIVGFNYGAGNYRRVKRAYFLAVGLGTALSVLATALFVLTPGPIIRMFGSADNALYLEFAQHFFRTYFLLYVFFGFQTITGIFFQAIGKPVQATALSLSYQILFKILSAVGLSALLGLDGVLWSGPIADLCAFLLTLALLLPLLRGMGAAEKGACP